MPTAEELIDEAIDLSDSGDYRKAHKLLTQAIKLDPSNAQAHFERAMVLMNMDRDKDALPDLERCLELNPSYPGARDWRARALKSVGKPLAAAEELLSSIRESPEGPYKGMGVNPQQWADCASLFAKAGESRTAITILDEYLDIHASKVTTYACYETAPIRVLTRLLVESGETERAVALSMSAYQNRKHRCPMDLVVHAQALEAHGNVSDALRVTNEALAENEWMQEAVALKQRLGGKSS